MKEDQKCYKLYKTNSSREDASKLCKNDNAYLPSIENNSEEQVIFNLLNDSNGKFWLGLKCTNITACFWDDGHVLGNCYYVNVNSSSIDYGEWVSEKCENELNDYVICQQESNTDQLYDCPKDYSRNEDNNDCYNYVSIPLTFEEANKNCQNNNSTLVSINSNEENMYILNLSNDKDKKENIWIGLTYKNGTLQWVDGSTLNEWNNLKNDSLEVKNEGSVIMLTEDGDDYSKWKVVNPSDKYPSVCRFKV